MVQLLQKLIKLYQWAISPWLGNQCRFVPNCSDYAQQALAQHGAVQGIFLSTKRLCRCHPFGGHGYDPVPMNTQHKNDNDQTKTTGSTQTT